MASPQGLAAHAFVYYFPEATAAIGDAIQDVYDATSTVVVAGYDYLIGDYIERGKEIVAFGNGGFDGGWQWVSVIAAAGAEALGLNNLVEAVSGYDVGTGQVLSTQERAIRGALGAFDFVTTAVPLGRGVFVGLKGAGKLGAVGARFGVPKLGALQNAATKIPKGLAGLSDDAARLSHNAARQSNELAELAVKSGRTRFAAPNSAVTRSSAWTRAEVNGTRVYQRSDLINPSLTDKLGRNNLQRMQQGLAPLGPDGKSINLHHMLQTADGPIAEVTQTFHKTYSNTIHINPNTIPSGIDRAAFNMWRQNYWINRANDFLPR
jgi:hypothetical protein